VAFHFCFSSFLPFSSLLRDFSHHSFPESMGLVSRPVEPPHTFCVLGLCEPKPLSGHLFAARYVPPPLTQTPVLASFVPSLVPALPLLFSLMPSDVSLRPASEQLRAHLQSLFVHGSLPSRSSKTASLCRVRLTSSSPLIILPQHSPSLPLCMPPP